MYTCICIYIYVYIAGDIDGANVPQLLRHNTSKGAISALAARSLLVRIPGPGLFFCPLV